jgi:dTMP kinase
MHEEQVQSRLIATRESVGSEVRAWAPNQARLIVIEGIDGSGSTTQVHRLFDHLVANGHSAFVTREPSDGPAGMLIRLALSNRLLGPNYEFHDSNEVLDDSGTALDNYTLALLFAADRADHIASQVRPNLVRNRHVLSDRYILSTLAYQGLNCSLDWLLEINRHALRPDLTFFLDVDPEVAHSRMRKTRWRKDLFETTGQQRLIRNRYLELIGLNLPLVGPVVVVDAARPASQVYKDLQRGVDKFLLRGEVDEARGELALPL